PIGKTTPNQKFPGYCIPDYRRNRNIVLHITKTQTKTPSCYNSLLCRCAFQAIVFSLGKSKAHACHKKTEQECKAHSVSFFTLQRQQTRLRYLFSLNIFH